MEVGHKVVLNGVEGEVTAVNVGADAKVFTVGGWPAGWGTALNDLAGYDLTSGGGFIGYKTDYDNDVAGTGTIEAIRAYMDSLGPNDSYNGATAQIEDWGSTLYGALAASAVYAVGEGVITNVAGLAGDGTHASESGATALIYDIGEITAWQVFV
jgi:hypothetical protein